MADRWLMHPATIAKLAGLQFAPAGPFMLCTGVELVPDVFGVLKEGERMELPEPLPLLPVKPLREQCDDALDVARYSLLRFPPAARFVDVDVGIDEAVPYAFYNDRREMVRMLHIRPVTQKEIRCVRQVLDRASNVRRRKRSAELERRRAAQEKRKGGA